MIAVGTNEYTVFADFFSEANQPTSVTELMLVVIYWPIVHSLCPYFLSNLRGRCQYGFRAVLWVEYIQRYQDLRVNSVHNDESMM